MLFPVADAKAVLEAPIAREPEAFGSFSGTILVIDDEEIVRQSVCDILQMQGFEVLTAVNGQDGVAQYRANQTAVNLIILDLSMPGMNGEETFHALRAINPKIQILLSSGYDEIRVAERIVDSDSVGFIQKPYHPEALMAQLCKQL